MHMVGLFLSLLGWYIRLRMDSYPHTASFHYMPRGQASYDSLFHLFCSGILFDEVSSNQGPAELGLAHQPSSVQQRTAAPAQQGSGCAVHFGAVTSRAVRSAWCSAALCRKTLRSLSYVSGIFFYFSFFCILPRIGKNKALAHHTSTYFHMRRVSI